jgi:hypothetical protein
VVHIQDLILILIINMLHFRILITLISGNPLLSASIYLPFLIMVVVVSNGTTTSSGSDFTLYAGNKIYEGGDNGTLLRILFFFNYKCKYTDWTNTASYFAFNGYSFICYFSGSFQEIRYLNLL